MTCKLVFILTNYGVTGFMHAKPALQTDLYPRNIYDIFSKN